MNLLIVLLSLIAGDGKPSDPNAVAMWVDDLGRLTPFGRTFDVYIQTGFDPEFSYPNGDPRRPYMIGSTRGNESPARSFGGRLKVKCSRTEDPIIFILGWITAKNVLNTGKSILGFFARKRESIGIAFSPIPTSDGCILVQSLPQSTGRLKVRKDAVQET